MIIWINQDAEVACQAQNTFIANTAIVNDSWLRVRYYVFFNVQVDYDPVFLYENCFLDMRYDSLQFWWLVHMRNVYLFIYSLIFNATS